MNVQDAIETLLDQRGPDKTICPSEAARMLAVEGDWRAQMDAMHQAVETMLADKRIKSFWKRERKEQRRGPYRIARR